MPVLASVAGGSGLGAALAATPAQLASGTYQLFAVSDPTGSYAPGQSMGYVIGLDAANLSVSQNMAIFGRAVRFVRTA
jgi:hypothetical protein